MRYNLNARAHTNGDHKPMWRVCVLRNTLFFSCAPQRKPFPSSFPIFFSFHAKLWHVEIVQVKLSTAAIRLTSSTASCKCGEAALSEQTKIKKKWIKIWVLNHFMPWYTTMVIRRRWLATAMKKIKQKYGRNINVKQPAHGFKWKEQNRIHYEWKTN